MTMLTRQLALVSQSRQISSADVMKVSAALQKQVTRDLSPIWGISATVDAFDSVEAVPLGYWHLIVRDDIEVEGARGIHEDEHGQPFALISASSRLDEWSLTASHEALEMLVDPSGNRLVAGDSLKSDQGRVSFLVEVCDPSEAADYAYSVNGVLVSDFYTPHYFDPLTSSGVRYSYTGALKEPRQVLPGGYLSWLDPTTGDWWQATVSDDGEAFRRIGPIDQRSHGNLRAGVDRFASSTTTAAIARGRGKSAGAGLTADVLCRASQHRGAQIHRDIAALLGRGGGGGGARPSGARRPTPSLPDPVPQG